MGITSKKKMDILFFAGMGVPYFPFQLGSLGDKTEITSNVANDFFFLFFHFIILDAIIFLLFLLNEKFCHLISKHPFVLIQSIHEWTKCICIGMYWEFSIYRNLLCGFLVIEVLVLILCSVAQN